MGAVAGKFKSYFSAPPGAPTQETPVNKSALEHARKILKIDDSNFYNIAIAGKQNAGKSTFINALCGHTNFESNGQVAKATPLETTLGDPSAYIATRFPNMRLYDVPGFGTLNVDSRTYFYNYGLCAMYCIILFYESAISQELVSYIKEAKRLNISVILIHSKADLVLRNFHRKDDPRNFPRLDQDAATRIVQMLQTRYQEKKYEPNFTAFYGVPCFVISSSRLLYEFEQNLPGVKFEIEERLNYQEKALIHQLTNCKITDNVENEIIKEMASFLSAPCLETMKFVCRRYKNVVQNQRSSLPVFIIDNMEFSDPKGTWVKFPIDYYAQILQRYKKTEKGDHFDDERMIRLVEHSYIRKIQININDQWNPPSYDEELDNMYMRCMRHIPGDRYVKRVAINWNLKAEFIKYVDLVISDCHKRFLFDELEINIDDTKNTFSTRSQIKMLRNRFNMINYKKFDDFSINIKMQPGFFSKDISTDDALDLANLIYNCENLKYKSNFNVTIDFTLLTFKSVAYFLQEFIKGFKNLKKLKSFDVKMKLIVPKSHFDNNTKGIFTHDFNMIFLIKTSKRIILYIKLDENGIRNWHIHSEHSLVGDNIHLDIRLQDLQPYSFIRRLKEREGDVKSKRLAEKEWRIGNVLRYFVRDD